MVPNNLLTDNIFRVLTAGSEIQLMSLPRLLAALGAEQVESIPGLQCHQEDIFHMFICYLAGAVLSREGCCNAVQDESFWYSGIVRLSGDKADSGWSLVVEDMSLPAFMQPPMVSNGQKPQLDVKAYSPDEIDVLQTAKNHDVKGRRASWAGLETWAYALISLQTSAGFLGQGNYGIARMNGGFGNRPCIGLVFESSPGGRFRLDVEKLLSARPKLLNDKWPYTNTGIVLTWMEAWDGHESLTLSQLDPFFIETARFVRLSKRGEQLVALGRATKTSRIYSKDFNGVVGDPWTPIKSGGKGKTSSLTLGKAGFTPDRLRELIFEDGFEPALMQIPNSGSVGRGCVFHGSSLVRGQGVTEGFHIVDLPIPSKAATSLFSTGSSRKSLEQMSKTGLNDAAILQNKVLKSSLYSLLEAGPDKLNFDKREISAWVEKAKNCFSDAWEDAFFPWLWSTADETDPEAARLRWLEKLRQLAREAFENATIALPRRSGRAYRARAKADVVFFRALYKNFPELNRENERK